MANEPLTEKLYVSAYCSGLGEKKAHGRGNIGCRRLNEGLQSLVEISIGRDTPTYGYKKHTAATAWITLTPAKAHELACLLMHLTHAEFPCLGEGIQTKGIHSYNLKVDVEFTTDLCTMLNRPGDLKQLILNQVKKRLDEIQLPEKKDEVPSV